VQSAVGAREVDAAVGSDVLEHESEVGAHVLADLGDAPELLVGEERRLLSVTEAVLQLENEVQKDHRYRQGTQVRGPCRTHMIHTTHDTMPCQ
jgi:hypothetical protein